MSNILRICKNLSCDGVHFEIYNEDDRDFWEPILYDTGFIQMEEHELYSIPFIDLEFNANLDQVRMTNHVIPLEQALPTAINSYGNKLVNSEAYDKLTTGEFDGRMSALYVNDNGEIEGCFLISDQGMNEGFTIEYANTEGCMDKTALFQMIKFSCEMILSYYTSDSLSGYALAMNPDVGTMIKKGFRHAKVADRCAVFVKVL